ncbi:MAG: prepilin-type N-terminal cleavage/methylation domain-containing protein [Armatimonadota bacterium]
MKVSANGGFTLVEVLAAVCLLSIGLMAVLAAGEAARNTQKRAVYMACGRTIAQNVLEELRSNPSYTLPSTTSPSLPAGNNISMSVTRYPSSSNTQIYYATVTVTWPEGNGTRRIFYETAMARK